MVSSSESPGRAVALLPVEFWKLDGAGNDFVAIDNRHPHLPEGTERERLVEALCARRGGLGTDGALVLERPSRPDLADVRMRYHNRDGGETEMCGNGARCLAAFAHHLGAAPALGMRIETQVGVQRADILDGERVRLFMPDVPPLRRLGPVAADLGVEETDFFRVGVPHAVVWLDDPKTLEALDVETVGRRLRNHPAFVEDGTNVNFAVSSEKAAECGKEPEGGGGSRIAVRTYERGVECETLACGTGSVASAISAVLSARARAPVAVRVRGGDDLTVDFEPTPEGGARRVALEGPARILFYARSVWDPATATLSATPTTMR